MREALRRHWPEYLMEAAGLGLFMLSACLFGALLEHPASPVRQAVPDGTQRRVLGGLAMGLTAAAIIYSPWGQRSGAHINPSVTLTFLRLGKVKAPDAAFYMAAQVTGGVLGVVLAAAVLGDAIADPSVNWAVTVPGRWGVPAAFLAEAAISFGLMLTVLVMSSSRHPRLTGVAAAILVAAWISMEGPLSGMSMNPARTVASALPSGIWTAAWIYFVAPSLGMLGAAAAFSALTRGQAQHCAKYDHPPTVRCIFCGAGTAASGREDL